MATLLSRITIDPAVCHGKPCVRGLRYSVETLLELLSSGMTHDEILADYEDLERDDLLAVLAYAAVLARTRRLQPVNPGTSSDAQLPRRAVARLTAAGCDARHSLDLPDANRTTDDQLNDLADREQRVVVTKDADFVDSHLLRGRPAKLLLVSTGNISNRDLEARVVPLIPDIVREFGTYSFFGIGPCWDRGSRVEPRSSAGKADPGCRSRSRRPVIGAAVCLLRPAGGEPSVQLSAVAAVRIISGSLPHPPCHAPCCPPESICDAAAPPRRPRGRAAPAAARRRPHRLR
jgi:uncharacterized protein (DUF433 family)/predicted nuclease of predicted toxin-antitoxin system